MLAIRTAGLGLSSLIGVCDDSSKNEDVVRSLVSEEYLDILVGMANERFVANEKRVARFEREIFGKAGSEEWERQEERRERKKREGLVRREALKSKTADESSASGQRQRNQMAQADDAFVSLEGLGSGI